MPGISKTFLVVEPRSPAVRGCNRLHTVGLLRASFRPEQQAGVRRSFLRHRNNLIEIASTHGLHMQKALNQMNLQIHPVLSDLTGQTGLAILAAILAGERDPKVLVPFRDPRVQASPETSINSRVGDYRPEHRFTLRQSLAAYRDDPTLIAACDREIEKQLLQFQTKVDVAAKPLPPPKVRRKKPYRQEPNFDLRAHQHRKSWLGNYFRRMRAKLGAPNALTAAAHKLARIVYPLLPTREPYDPSLYAKYQEQSRARATAKLKAQAPSLGFQLVPLPAALAPAQA
jgi:hypothetical protein